MAIPSFRLVLLVSLLLPVWTSVCSAELVGWWAFDEPSGTVALDSSPEGSNHVGALESGASFMPSGGKFGGAVSLDGEDDIVRIADHSDFEFDASTSFTIAFWFRTDANFPNTRGFVTKGYDASPHTAGYYIVRAGGDEIPEFDSRETSAGSPRMFFDSGAAIGDLRDGKWHHIVVIRDVVAGQARIYYDNGNPVSETLSGNGDWDMGINSHDLILGQYAGRWTEGEFDDVGIWKNEALAAEDVAEIYKNGIAGLAETDTDGDGVADSWEVAHFGDLDENELGDFDSDGLLNGEEFSIGTDPTEPDSDDDGLSDGAEFNLHETDPTDSDSDDDGLSDGAEITIHFTNPHVSDSDGDALTDGAEVSVHFTKPLESDSDGDGFSDGVEVAAGSNPNDLQSKPDVTDLDDVVINEFMAFNDAALLDEDGDSSDWIELWNPNALIPISLAGWFLTDDPEDLMKWAFPPTTLEPNSFVVVFASGKDRAVSGAELHTSFSLKKEGGYLALTRPGGAGGAEIVHQFNLYGRQFQDVSFGLYGTTDPLPSGYFNSPTPNAANNESAVQGFVADTTFSIDRGFYSSPQTVVVSSATPGASLIYTIDGTIPDDSPLNGTRVDAPDALTPPSASIEIVTTTQLRVRGVKEGFEPTNVDTQSYIFPDSVLQQGIPSQPFQNWGSDGPDWEMDREVVNHSSAESRVVTDDLLEIPSLSISLPFADMWGSASGIYADANQNAEKFCSIEYLNPDGDPTSPNGGRKFQTEGTIQIVGGSSPRNWKANKLSMRLKFSSSRFKGTDGKPLQDLRERPFDKDWIPYGKEATDRYDTLVLDARLNQVWTHPDIKQRERGQYVRDQYIADLQNALGGTAPHGRHMHVYISGLYWGMYTVHERPDDDFAAEYFGGNNDDYDVIKHKKSTVVAGTNDNYLKLLSLADANLSSKSNYEAIAAILDVEDFARYMLVNYYGGNGDWAHHNWYASYNRIAPNGKWRFHSWDAEHVLKEIDDDSTELEDNDDDQGPAIVQDGLMDSPEYKLVFADLVRKEFFNDGNLTPANALAHYMRRLNIVNEAIRAESARWGDNKNGSGAPHVRGEDWIEERDRLVESYFPRRTDIVLQQLKSRGWYPATDAPDFVPHGGDVADGFALTISSPDGGKIYYTLDGSDPREAFSAEATGAEYVAPVPLADSVCVKARVLKGGEWSALTEAQFIVGAVEASSNNLTVSEIHYRPASPSEEEIAAGFGDRGEFEFLELHNTSNDKVKLSNLSFSEGIDFDFRVHSSIFRLLPGERVILVENLEAFVMRYGTDLPVAGEFQNGSQLANEGETLTLINHSKPEESQVVQSITFSDQLPWPVAADGDGYSLTLANSAESPDATLASNWRASFAIGGSPGSDDGGDEGETLNEWLNRHDLVEGDEFLDQDGDQLISLMEYAFGTDPLTSNSNESLFSSIVSAEGGNYLSMSYPRSKIAKDVSFVPQFSTDLVTWTTATDFVNQSSIDEGRDRITVRSTVPLADEPNQFMRLQVKIK